MASFIKSRLGLAVHCVKNFSPCRLPFKANPRLYSNSPQLATVGTMATNGANEKKPFQRLPTNVVPKHYRITLSPDLKKFTFTGSQVVDIEIKQETDKIILNALDLDLSVADYKSSKNETQTSTKVILSKEDETATIEFASPLKPGTGQLHMNFTGELNDKLKGFYRSKYVLDGEERYAAVTQFESTDARRAFPCWVRYFDIFVDCI